MELSAKYNPTQTEDKWYSYWMKNKLFRSVPDDREPYTIVIPPPNVTGVLHMGHMLNNTIQDILIRRERMRGKNACWVPGTDHASIATEARVVAKLASEGVTKRDIGRDAFIKEAWDWTHKHGGIILEQLKKLGASCDWERTCFTMDNERSESVIKVFVDLYNKGLIYRGIRMVNWDPKAKTAVSDEEVYYKEVQSKLYYVKYFFADNSGFLTVATTRPETILGDTAVCVNPDDERYKGLSGKKVIVPLVNREVPVIYDSYVDPAFGTGALKVTPAHDINDYEIGLRHKLEVIDIFNDDGSLNEKAQVFVGTDRFEARKLAVEKLQQEGLLLKSEDYNNKIGYSERTHVIIEPRLSVQWFLKMKELSKPALENVLNGNIKLYPQKFINTYRHWMENVKDWCISRQLWWGHQIPAYYLPDGDFVVAATVEEALEKAIKKTGNQKLTIHDLRQDEDVLDTWFSSWLWPVSVFDGIRNPGNADMKYYYPTNDLVTAPEILFFWVARMIIAGYEFAGNKPFENVYLTGLVRDKLGRKMSKSLGNSPDPLELIAKYGADGVRIGMLLCSPAGNDLLFDDSLPEQGRNFANKIWNAFRLVKGWQVQENLPQPTVAVLAGKWFESKLNQAIVTLDDHFIKFRLSEALMVVYKLFWDDFSGWYLEMIKPAYQQPIDAKTQKDANRFFEILLRLLHPFMPFISEELWQNIENRQDGDSIMKANWPQGKKPDENIIDNFEKIMVLITEIRNIRQSKNLSPRQELQLIVKGDDKNLVENYQPVLLKLSNINEIKLWDEKVENAVSFRIHTTEFYIPLGSLLDKEEEIKKLEDELKYQQDFLNIVMKKLENEKFKNNAPKQVVDMEEKKKTDAETKIKIIKERISALKK